MSESLQDRLVRVEGLKLKPYKDSVGKITIGVGRNLDDVGISKSEAMLMLENDVRRAKKAAKEFDWFWKLNEPRQEVIIEMLFNIGKEKFLEFKKTIAAIEAGDYETASFEMLNSLWAQQVGDRAEDLARTMIEGH